MFVSVFLIPDIEVMELQHKTVVILQVAEYPVKPVAVQGRYYKRVGSSNHLLRVSEISDLFMRSMQYSWDSYPFPGARYEDLNLQSVGKFITKVNTIGRFHLSEDPFEALTKLHLLKDGIPVNAAMLLFSKEDLLYNVHIGRFKTPSLIIADHM